MCLWENEKSAVSPYQRKQIERIIPVQVFSMILAEVKGENLDSPRNLTKVVKL